MIGIVIVAHGGLAQELRETVEHVTGPQPGVVAVAIGPECDRTAKQAEICGAADRVDSGDGVVIVTDMFGGSPSNLSMRACAAPSRRIVYGANVPLLIKLVQCRRKPLALAVELSLKAAHKYMNSYETASDADLLEAHRQRTRENG